MKNRLYKLRFGSNGKKLLLPIAFCAVTTAILLMAVQPIMAHIELAVEQETYRVLEERPTIKGVAQEGEVLLSESGGYPTDGEALGSIRIGGTSVDCTLYFGDGSAQRHAGAGIWAGGKIPGQGGTVLVAGHTNSFFRDLESVKEGADITLETRYGEFHYRVTGTRVAMAEDTTAYDLEAQQENIILYTCYPFGQVTLTPERYFVYGEYVSGPHIKEEANATENG